MSRPLPGLARKVWHDPIYFLAFGFGSGLMPIAPGTWGTIMALPLYWLLAGYSWVIYLIVILFAFVLGIFLCDKVSRDLNVHDYSGIVWDEVVGYLCTMFLIPSSFRWSVIGFVLFRLFDIWKPQPIRWLDKSVKGGLGIMLDDILAAIFAWFFLQLLVWWWV